jgi:hypothetical protein
MPVNLSFEKGFGDFKKFVEVRFDVVHCVFVCFVTYLNKITTSFISTTYQQMLIAQHVNFIIVYPELILTNSIEIC